jgi:SAP domain
MPTTTKPYAVAAGQARTAVERTADIWAQGARTLTGILPGIPQLDLVPAVERYFDFVQHTVEVNRDFALRWARAASWVSGTVHDQAETAKQAAREKAGQASEMAKEEAAKAEHDFVAEAQRAERERARREYASARERYESMTKAELSDQLAERDLPKTGDKEELVERLVEADT